MLMKHMAEIMSNEISKSAFKLPPCLPRYFSFKFLVSVLYLGQERKKSAEEFHLNLHGVISSFSNLLLVQPLRGLFYTLLQYPSLKFPLIT